MTNNTNATEPKMTYKIVRNYFNSRIRRRTIKTGLTLEQAQAHCRDPQNTSTTCTTHLGRARTIKIGHWFDGFDRE